MAAEGLDVNLGAFWLGIPRLARAVNRAISAPGPGCGLLAPHAATRLDLGSLGLGDAICRFLRVTLLNSSSSLPAKGELRFGDMRVVVSKGLMCDALAENRRSWGLQMPMPGFVQTTSGRWS
jgi:hypothetical protein